MSSDKAAIRLSHKENPRVVRVVNVLCNKWQNAAGRTSRVKLPSSKGWGSWAVEGGPGRKATECVWGLGEATRGTT